MGKPDDSLELLKKRKMRSNREKRRRKERAIIKCAAASEAVAQKIEESVGTKAPCRKVLGQVEKGRQRCKRFQDSSTKAITNKAGY